MANRTVLIAGATGLVGRELLEGLLSDPNVQMVHSLGRKPPTLQHPRLISHIVDFAHLPPLPSADEVYLAVGTTIKVAGSQAAFRAVDYDANMAVAKAALAAGARTVGLVSAMGADSRSKVFYSRVKGDLETALAELPFEGVVIARPSMLVGDRGILGQPIRRGEVLAAALGRIAGFLIPANYKPIGAKAVSRALLSRVPSAKDKIVLLSGSMR
jgi:uncharacterized protein YbjT (DUF2867 family)